jgi:hypothetical protein
MNDLNLPLPEKRIVKKEALLSVALHTAAIVDLTFNELAVAVSWLSKSSISHKSNRTVKELTFYGFDSSA